MLSGTSSSASTLPSLAPLPSCKKKPSKKSSSASKSADGNWTEAEHELLMLLVGTDQSRREKTWPQLAKDHFPGRSEHAVKSHWGFHIKDPPYKYAAKARPDRRRRKVQEASTTSDDDNGEGDAASSSSSSGFEDDPRPAKKQRHCDPSTAAPSLPQDTDPGSTLLLRFHQFRAAFSRQQTQIQADAYASITAELVPGLDGITQELMEKMMTAPARWTMLKEQLDAETERKKEELKTALILSLEAWYSGDGR